MKTLVVGPAICEFGWNLCAYNPFARKMASHYDNVVVCCPPGEEYIWEFATSFYHVHKPDRADRWLIKNGRPIKIPKILKEKYPDADFITPNKVTCTSKDRIYRKLGTIPMTTGTNWYNILFHARNTKKYNQDDRNWPVKNFQRIVKAFPHAKIGSIGTQAHHIPGTTDLRCANLETLCDIIWSSDLVIGPSSGPMHLASLCQTSHIVWTYKKKERAIAGTNRDRYEKLWNPFNTRVEVVDKYGWQPPPEVIIKKIKKHLTPPPF